MSPFQPTGAAPISPRWRFSLRAWLVFCVVAGLLLGVGGPPIWRAIREFISRRPEGTIIHGKIYKGGVPVKVANPGAFPVKAVYFFPQFKGGYVDGVEIAEDGSFELRGYGVGLPPGKYKIGVELRVEFDAPDQLNGGFSEKRTPIIRKIDNSGDQDLGIIDLDKPNP